jgi:hypothetical protein
VVEFFLVAVAFDSLSGDFGLQIIVDICLQKTGV